MLRNLADKSTELDEVKQDLTDKKSEVREQEQKLTIIKEDADETIQKAKFAEELIDYFRNTNSGDREKAYDFMRQFTINGMNMLEHFLRSIGEWVQQKVAGMSR